MRTDQWPHIPPRISVYTGALALYGVVVAIGNDWPWPVMTATALAGWALAACWPMLAVSVWFRRWRSAAINGLVGLMHLWIIAPIGPTVPPFERGVSLRVVTMNLLYQQQDHGPQIEELVALDADLVMLQEVTNRFEKISKQPPFSDVYPHCVVAARSDAFGNALCSKRPFKERRLVSIVGVPASVGLIDVDGIEVLAASVHFYPPTTQDLYEWQGSQASQFVDLLFPDGFKHAIVGGDLNITPHNPRHAMATQRLDDAHQRLSAGALWTWPNRISILPPLTLDYVLVSKNIGVNAVQTGIGAGSDHKPVVADLRLFP